MPTDKKLTRRDFLQFAGLTGLALPAGALVAMEAGSGHRSPELYFSDEAGRPQRPWWVKQVDQPTVEIDWARKRRFDAGNSLSGGGQNLAKYLGEELAENVNLVNESEIRKRIADNVPGYTLKDFALLYAQEHDVFTPGSFLGPENVESPEQPWQGSPEEAARIVRVAMRHFGAAQVGFVELDENTRKLIYSVDRDQKRLIFEKGTRAYETDEKRVIPETAKWAIVYTVRMSSETLKRAPTIVGSQTCMLSYSRGRFVQSHTQAFLRGLGYQCLGQVPLNGLGLSVGFGVLAGLGELSRLNRMITPEYGPMVRVFFMLTDLPLAVDKPIDAGTLQFCKTCKKCAESCPAAALSYDDEPLWETRGDWNSPGHRAYFENSVDCLRYWREQALGDCGICFAVCPFSKKDMAWIHDLIHAGVAKVPDLDGFFRSMDDAFSYGAQKDPEAWWHMDLPEHGLE